MKTFRFASLLAAILVVGAARSAVAAQTTAFTYQGQLTATAGGPVNNASLTITFALYDAATSGNLVSVPSGINPVSTSGSVVDGLFTRSIDYGLVFTGTTQYWVEVAVVDGSGTHILAPRQLVNSVPVAQYALSGGSISGIAAGGDLTGTYPNPAIGSGKVTLAKHAGSDITGTLGGASIGAFSCFQGAVGVGGAQVGDQVMMTFTGTQPPAGLIVYTQGVKTAGQAVVNNCNVTNATLVLPALPVHITTWR